MYFIDIHILYIFIIYKIEINLSELKELIYPFFNTNLLFYLFILLFCFINSVTQ